MGCVRDGGKLGTNSTNFVPLTIYRMKYLHTISGEVRCIFDRNLHTFLLRQRSGVGLITLQYEAAGSSRLRRLIETFDSGISFLIHPLFTYLIIMLFISVTCAGHVATPF